MVEDHLWEKGIDEEYETWTFHEEKDIVDCGVVRYSDIIDEEFQNDEGPTPEDQSTDDN